MRSALAWLGLSALVAATPVTLAAAPALRGIMHAWRADAQDAHDMLTGRAAFDEATLRNTFQGYAADAGRIAAQVNGRTNAARDFKARFVAFQAASQKALGDLGHRSALQADFSRLLNDCRSCHNQYNN